MPRHSPKWEETSPATLMRWALGPLLLIMLLILLIPH